MLTYLYSLIDMQTLCKQQKRITVPQLSHHPTIIRRQLHPTSLVITNIDLAIDTDNAINKKVESIIKLKLIRASKAVVLTINK
jgi:hypothetical protein